MSQPASPRRTFLGHVLSGTAALWVSATGLLSTVLAACEPVVAKYGGPPPDSQPTVPLGGGEQTPSDGTQPGTTAPGTTESGATESGDGPFASPPPDGSAAPTASATASAEPPLAVPKYGGPAPGPITVKYGGPMPPPTFTAPPPVKPKYGGPPMTTKYGGPRKYGGPPPGF